MARDVQLVGAALGGDVHDAADGAAALGVDTGGVDGGFLQSFDGDLVLGAKGAILLVGDLDAVDVEAVPGGRVAVGLEAAGAGIVADTGLHEGKRVEVASLGQAVVNIGGDGHGDAVGGGVAREGFGADGDAVADLADDEFGMDGGDLTEGDVQTVDFERGEAGLRNGNRNAPAVLVEMDCLSEPPSDSTGAVATEAPLASSAVPSFHRSYPLLGESRAGEGECGDEQRSG